MCNTLRIDQTHTKHRWLKSVQQYFTSPAPMAHEASVSTLVQEPAHHHQKQHSQKPQQQSQAQVTHVRSKTTKTQALVIEETATQRGKSVDILRSHQSSNQYNASKVSLGSGGDAAESQHSPQSYEMSKSMTHLPLTEPELARASASKQKGVSKEDVILLDNNAQSNDSSATTTLNSSPIHSQSSSIYQASTAFPKNPLSGSGSLSRLKYHHGPIDQRALSSKDPWSLLTDIATALIKQGMQVSFSDQPCRIKVVRQSNLTRGSAGSIKSSHSTHSLAGLITSFPLSLMRRIKYMATFGTSYNSGFDGSSTSSSSSRSQGPPSAASPTGGNQEEIRLYIEIQRIKNLPGLYLVEFKRLKGNIWAFKKLYQELIVALPVKDGKFVI